MSFFIPQAEIKAHGVTYKERTDNKASKYVHNGYLNTSIKDLKDIGEEIWYEIKQNQSELHESIL